MRREEIFFDAITSIRERLVEEAQEYRFRQRRPVWARYAPLAACLVLAATLCVGVYRISQIRMGGGNIGSTDSNGSVAPPQSAEGAQPEDGASSGGANLDAGEPNGEPETNPWVDFTGPVLEVGEDYLLVLWEEPVEVPITGLEELPSFREGDVVTVVCVEVAIEGGRAAASGVEGIWLVEP